MRFILLFFERSRSILGGRVEKNTYCSRQVRAIKISKLLISLLTFLITLPCFATQPAYVAGGFYPGDAKQLQQMVDGFLGKPPEKLSQEQQILIVPHAGYPFSGATAGSAFHEIHGAEFPLVIIVGVAHRVPVDGAALDPEGTFETPLGKIEIDSDAAKKLLSLSSDIHAQPEAFKDEHSVEVELPFLQRALKGPFKIVALILQEPDLKKAESVGKAIAGLIKEDQSQGKRILIVNSTDFAHYPKDADARASDEAMLKQIEAIDPEGLRRESETQMSKGIPNLATTMCGEAGTLAVLYAARELGIKNVRVLSRATSADSPIGDSNRTVGYAGVVMSGPVVSSAPPSPPANTVKNGEALSPEQEKELLKRARESVEQYVKTGKRIKPDEEKDEAFREAKAVFITLRKSGELRGCIGSIMPEFPLGEAVYHYALRAATKDPRFKAVTQEELPFIDYEVSVLSKPERVAGPDDIRPEIDGVVIMKNSQGGVFLPQVWKETGWTRDQFLSELASQKAGLPPDAWKDPSTQLFRFTVHAFGENELKK